MRTGYHVAAPNPEELHRRRVRQLVWGVAFVLVGLAVGFAAGLPFGTRPEGQASVLMRPLPGSAFSTRAGDALVDLKTEAQLIFADDVLDRVVTLDDHRVTVNQLRHRLGVKVVDNTEVLHITYHGRSSAEATRTAQHVADALLEVRALNAAEANRARTKIVQDQLTKTENQFDTASESGADPATIAVLGRRIVSLRSDLRTIGGTPASAGTVLAVTAPRQSEIRKLRLGLLVLSALGAGCLGVWFGRRVHSLPRRLRERLDLRHPVPARQA